MHPFCPSSSFPSAAASTKSLQEAARPSPKKRTSSRLRATDPPLSPGLPPPTRQPKKSGNSATPERAVPGKATGHLAAAISTSTSPHKQVATHLLTTLSSPHVDKHLAAVGDFITPAVIKALNAHHAVPTETSVELPPDTSTASHQLAQEPESSVPPPRDPSTASIKEALTSFLQSSDGITRPLIEILEGIHAHAEAKLCEQSIRLKFKPDEEVNGKVQAALQFALRSREPRKPLIAAATDATTEDAARAAKAAADVDEAGDVSRSSSDASASAVSLDTQSRASKRLAGGAYNEQDDSDSGGDSGGDANDGPWQSDEETQPLPKKQRYLKCTTQCALKSTFCNP